MPTKFSTIYERAVFKFTDYSFLTALPDHKEGMMQQYLLSAISDFQPKCTTADLLKYDLETEEFEDDLDEESKEILALGIAFYWLSGRAINRELLKNRIYNSDYTSYSPANLLKEVQTLRDSVGKEYRGKMNLYSFRHGNIETLKV